MTKIKDLDTETVSKTKRLLGRIFIYLIIATILFGSFYIVGAGERAVVVTLGKAGESSMTPGFHFKLPFIQKAIKFDVKTQKYEADATAASSDLQTVNAKLAINYHLLPESIPLIYKEIGLDYSNRIIQPLEQEVVKATTARFTAEELITKREQVRDDMKNTLRERLALRGIIVEEVSIVNFDFSPSFNAAIEAKVTAEQNALAAKNKLAQVEYEAKQRITQATAEAEAIKIQAQAIQAQGGKEYTILQFINRWDGKLPGILSESGNSNMGLLLNAPSGGSGI